ncbi:MAG: sulfatase-like hydrolase/transferase [Rickettsiales bacterium]|nr:sulfatase-like hydrolase/transferase [Rickettsiales bacterium]
MLRRMLPFGVIFIVVQTLLRLSLLGRAYWEVDFTTLEIGKIVLLGLYFDVVVAGFFLIPLALYHVLLPKFLHGSPFDRKIDAMARFLFLAMLLFDSVAEHLFWTEFSTRFNFIAVDYLVYTQEVIGNIVESYPVHWLLIAIAVISCGLAWLSLRLQPMPKILTAYPFKRRAVSVATACVLCLTPYLFSDADQAKFRDNAMAGEVAANGIYNLFHAFWHNEIHYSRFYATKSDQEVEQNARDLLFESDADVTFVHEDGKDLTRLVKTNGKEKHYNVMLVVMESMSAEYMEAFGNQEVLTPNLDRLSQQGLFFTNTFATGTRTVRGLEAVTLSIPPTPGQSIVRRPANDNLFSLGFIFRDRGYNTRFIYGGYGYFDNMSTFFSGNGFDVIDRTNMPEERIHFANIWGVCDEDMFTRAIEEADKSFADQRPFLQFIMTTSNHRPFTYPDGRIDIPSHAGRFGGVKYADYSVGKLIEEARNKPWFKDTIFVFVADHTAGAGGKAELDPRKYHIPMLFYAPEIIQPERFEAITSQIDLSPILLGLMDFTYYTKFYGEDLLHDEDEIPHAFISNYQKIALVKEDGLTVLAPKQRIEQFHWPDIKAEDKENDALVKDAIAYYQSASWWREHYKRIPTVVPSAQ